MEQEIEKVVFKHGWDAISISDCKPPFLYTIGFMQTRQHPEMIMFGLEADQIHALFSVMFEEIGSGRSFADPGIFEIRIGEDIHGIGVRHVHNTRHEQYMGFAMGYLRHIGRFGELEAVQIYWPDSAGKFPFETGFDLGIYELQPRLDIGLTPREMNLWQSQFE